MAEVESTNPEEILGTYKRMLAECQQIASKISEVCCVVALCTMVLFTIDTDTKSWFLLQLTLERDEHKLVVDTLSKLESERKAFRLVGGVLVERTVGDVLPAVSQNYEGVKLLLLNMLTWDLIYCCLAERVIG